MRILHGVVLLVVGCLLVAGCTGRGGNEAASTVPPTSTSTASTLSLPTELQGAWHEWRTWQGSSYRLTLADCVVGQECGRLAHLSSGEYCVYALTYRSQDIGGYLFKTSSGKNMNCAWSGWSRSVVRLTPRSDGTLFFGIEHLGSSVVTLNR